MHTCPRASLRVLATAAVIGVSLTLTACAGRGGGPKDTAYVARDVETLYASAKDRLDRGQPTLAAALFDEVERQHPYSPWARRAQLMSAFSYYVARHISSVLRPAATAGTRGERQRGADHGGGCEDSERSARAGVHMPAPIPSAWVNAK